MLHNTTLSLQAAQTAYRLVPEAPIRLVLAAAETIAAARERNWETADRGVRRMLAIAATLPPETSRESAEVLDLTNRLLNETSNVQAAAEPAETAARWDRVLTDIFPEARERALFQRDFENEMQAHRPPSEAQWNRLPPDARVLWLLRLLPSLSAFFPEQRGPLERLLFRHPLAALLAPRDGEKPWPSLVALWLDRWLVGKSP